GRLTRPQARPRRDARPGITALPPQRRAARKTVRHHEPDHSADGFAAVGARVRAVAEEQRGGTGEAGWVEEKVDEASQIHEILIWDPKFRSQFRIFTTDPLYACMARRHLFDRARPYPLKTRRAPPGCDRGSPQTALEPHEGTKAMDTVTES